MALAAKAAVRIKNNHWDEFDYFIQKDHQIRSGTENKAHNTDEKRRYSVLILGFDGMSRLNFERQMPRTANFLEESGGITLFGYNKVGYNTFPNLVPLLTGLNTSELTKLCSQDKYTVYDRCPFIWKSFKASGYYTSYGEDLPDASTFHFKTPGFRVKPVDYYVRPYFLACQGRLPVRKLQKVTSIVCLGNRENLVRFENVIRGFVSNMKNRPTFGMFWINGLSHDYLNYQKLFDKMFRQMFDSLKTEGALENTVLITLSDHGIRWGEFRETFQGFLEERLPLANIVLPETFKKSFPQAFENLKSNSHQLTSPFDLHETLWSVLNTSGLHPGRISNETMRPARGISLFHRLPDRNCPQAGIPTEWCACRSTTRISGINAGLEQWADLVVAQMNKDLLRAPQCLNLTLRSVRGVWVDEPVQRSDHLMTEDLIVTFEVLPSFGLFEAILRRDLWTGTTDVVGGVSRLDMYQDQSSCVSDSALKLICYCKPDRFDTSVKTVLNEEMSWKMIPSK